MKQRPLWLSYVALAIAVAACPGSDDARSLVVVEVKSDAPIAVTDVRVAVGAVSHTVPLTNGLSGVSTKVGVYTSATGPQAVSVRAPSAGCPSYEGNATTESLAPGKTVSVVVSVQLSAGCNPDGGAAGMAGGSDGGVTPVAGAAGGAGGTAGVAGSGGRDGGAPDVTPPPPADPPSLTKCIEVEHTPDQKCEPDASPSKYDWAIWNVAFSPDGALLAVAGDDGHVKLWDVTPSMGTAGLKANGRVISGDGTTHLAYAPDGSKLVVGSGLGSVSLYNMPAVMLYSALTGHTDDLNEVAFSSDSAVVASADASHVVKVWSVATKAPLATVTIPSAAYTVALLPGGAAGARWTVVGTNTGDLVVFNAAAPTPALKTLHIGDDLYVNTFSVSPDGRTLAVGTDDGTVTLWNITDPGNPVAAAAPFVTAVDPTRSQGINGVAFSPSGKHLAVSAGSNNSGGAVRIYDVATKAKIAEHVPTWFPLSVAWSPDGRAVAAGEIGCGIVAYCRD